MGLVKLGIGRTVLRERLMRVSSRASSTWNSGRIRETFISYFCEEHGHRFIPSSSTVPRSKSEGTYFTNAGMNQFKPIFLGGASPESPMANYRRVVNSQKCVRVGGKHNDLDDVGRDGYHHTFFEMLGNWSFDNFFKKEICTMSWRLLTEVYGLPRDRMYVTYFAGNEEWNLTPDEECREIWLDIGIPEERILPFGVSDNFWMMGETGPCGPCSEIHYDHVGARDAAPLVNRDCPSVTELWNLVFMQYDRQKDGQLRRLPKNHVDTGMGLERLTAVLQNKTSNYDTDLFLPIIQSIQKISGAGPYEGLFSTNADDLSRVDRDIMRDTAYRIIADHIRMMCVVIADGLLPGKQGLEHKLRQIMYRCFDQAYTVLQAPRGLIVLLVDDVLASLGGFYPELRQNYTKIKSVISQTEEYYFTQLRQKNKNKAKVAATKTTNSSEKVTKEKDEVIERLVIDQFVVKKLRDLGVPETDDSHKYTYTRGDSGNYDFPVLESKIVAILEDNHVVDQVTADHVTKVGLITELTNFYAEAGGQVSDRGTISSTSGAEFTVDSVESYQNYVLHTGKLTSGAIRNGDSVRLAVDQIQRNACMRNHTATHLLQRALRDVLGNDVTQRGSLVDQDRLTFDFSYMGKLSDDQVEQIQSVLNDMVSRRLPVSRRQMTLQEAERLPGLLKLAGETYPNTVNVVSVDESLSVELCGGTHVENTSDLLSIVITKVTGVSQGTKRVTAMTGVAAQQMLIECDRLRGLVADLAWDIKTKTRHDQWNEKFKAIDTVFSTRPLPKMEKERIYKNFDFLRAQAADYVNALNRERWKKEIETAMKDPPEDGLIRVECDFTHHKQIVKLLSKMKPTCPIIVHNKPGNSWTCIAYVPETFSYSAVDWLNHGFREVTSARHVIDKNRQCGIVNVNGHCPYDDVLQKLSGFTL